MYHRRGTSVLATELRDARCLRIAKQGFQMIASRDSVNVRLLTPGKDATRRWKGIRCVFPSTSVCTFLHGREGSLNRPASPTHSKTSSVDAKRARSGNVNESPS
ncbi:hypothetical protein CERSUDRAFT_117396 [Gelatoporia subvermispora B]|uniref:Uncharacterized protein n=1 Tax=Ceriporiopsis subvermispora (strain B) TaxID=914234 RepID=M2R6L7_CERS8|nr:hypothetical protein CERSUDRAFT_117396 [Gelatoporia subvermispora B]